MSGWRLLPWKAFSEFTADWDRLNQTLYQGHPLLDSLFIAALLNHFAQPRTSLVIYQATDKPVSNLLLLEPGKSHKWRTFLPSQAQVAPVLCSNPGELARLAHELPGFAWAIDILCQDPLYSFSWSALPFLDHFAHATTINIAINGSFTDYWQQRPHNLQKNVRRYFNRLNKNSITYKLNRITNSDELASALQRYGELESKSWKGATGTAIHHENLQGRFYLDALQNFAASQQAEIVELYFDEKLAASRINLLNPQILIILKTSYDEDLAEYAPGRLLLYLLIEREFELKRVDRIEFYTNATSDQISWSTGQRNIEHLMLHRSAKTQWMHKNLRHIKAKLTQKT